VTWDPITDPVDYILLAGKRSPGLAEVKGAGSPREWDIRKGYGLSGAASVFTGLSLAKFTVTLRLYTVEDWADWHVWKPLVDKVPKRRGGEGKDSGKLDISHPLLWECGIKAAGVEDVKQPEQTGDGEWSIEILFIEFRMPKFALAKPEGAAATTVDPVEEEWIKPLMQQVQRLASEP
jgi:hypothetical protein